MSVAPRSLLRRQLGARGAALLTLRGVGVLRGLVICGIVVPALWGGALARADETPPAQTTPTPTTTTPDAPPPDPYAPPKRSAKPKQAPRRVAPVARYVPTAPARVYERSAPTAPRHAARSSRHPKVVRTHRKPPARRAVRSRPVSVSLAPLSHLIAAARITLPPATERDRPYLWLAGISFAILATAGSGLLVISLRVFRTGWE